MGNVKSLSARLEEIILESKSIDLIPDVSAITDIPAAYLKGAKVLWQYSVAQKMSWSSNRKTTRKEDEAYCLLGIFDVNMPLLYGEGSRASKRLQEEIIKRSPDQSVLAWTGNIFPSLAISPQASFALGPQSYANAGNIVWDRELDESPFAVTNLGLQMNSDLWATSSTYGQEQFFMLELNCIRPDGTNDERGLPVTILLKELQGHSGKKLRTFMRLVGIEHPTTEHCQKVNMERPFYIVDSMDLRIRFFR